ncbi:MAG: hypothetical protein J2P15_16675 [Micromonosporaceae bacterium]|nr:hypothetical protein [Micromonosporaceae bacterium]
MSEATQAALIWRAEHPTTIGRSGEQTVARIAAALTGLVRTGLVRTGLVRRAPLAGRRTAAGHRRAQVRAAN